MASVGELWRYVWVRAYPFFTGPLDADGECVAVAIRAAHNPKAGHSSAAAGQTQWKALPAPLPPAASTVVLSVSLPRSKSAYNIVRFHCLSRARLAALLLTTPCGLLCC
jgi:hypothetical protein